MNVELTYHKNKKRKWLLTVTLLLGIFTFSGYIGNYQSKQQQAQSELVISRNYQTHKRTISYKKAFELVYCSDYLINTYQSWTNTLFIYNSLTKVKFAHLSKQFCSHKSIENFLRVKPLSGSPQEEIIVNSLG